MGETVRRPDGTVVPLETWKLDGLAATVESLQRIVDEASQNESVHAVEGIYESFGVRSFPAVLSLVRQLPGLIEELRRHRERYREREAEPKGLFGKYVVFNSRHITDEHCIAGVWHVVANPDGDGRQFAEPLTGCFVLRPEKDKAARVALMFYATACEGDSPELARDLRAWVKRLEAEKPLK